jgi:hypothetical protein
MQHEAIHRSFCGGVRPRKAALPAMSSQIHATSRLYGSTALRSSHNRNAVRFAQPQCRLTTHLLSSPAVAKAIEVLWPTICCCASADSVPL